MTAEDIWAALESDVAAHHDAVDGIVRRRARSDGGRNLYLAVHVPSGQRILQLETGQSAELGPPPSTAAVTATLHTPPVGPAVISLTLAEPSIITVFAAFVDDVIDHVTAAPDDRTAHDALLERHRHWRRLLSGGDHLLSPAARQGLFGELWTLAHLAAPTIGPAAAIRAWTGPAGDDHDFTTTTAALEVKTVSHTAHGFVVSNKRQLDDTGLHALVLAVLRVEATGGGTALNDIIDTVRHIAPPAERPLLEDCLLDYGYREADRESYGSPRWELRTLILHHIVDGFPRLLPDDLPAGVDDISYTVNLGACDPWRVAPEQLARLLTP